MSCKEPADIIFIFPQEAPDIFQTKPEYKLLLLQLLTLLHWAADSFPHDQTDKFLTS
jgi:hypothetical protein